MAGVIKETLVVKDEASAAFKQAGDSAEKADKSFKGAGDAAGRAGEGAAKLRGVLSTLGPEFGEVAGFANDAFDAVEVLSGSLSALNPLTMTLGAVAGAATAALIYFGREAEQAAQMAALLHDTNQSLVPSVRALEDAQLDLALALGRLTEAQAEQQRVALAAQRGVQDFAESQRQQREELKESIATNEKWLERLRLLNIVTAGAAIAGTTLADTIFGFSDSIDHANEQIGVLNDAVEREAETQKAARVATQAATEALDRKERAAKSLERAEEALAAMEDFRARMTAATNARIKEHLDILSGMFTPQVDRAAEALGAFGEVLDGIIPAKALTDTEKLALAEADLTLAFTRNAITATQYAEAMERLGSARERVATSERLAEANRAAGAAAGGVSGGPEAGMSALASSSGIGALVVSVIDLVVNLKETLTSFGEYHNDIMHAVASLPAALANNVETIFNDSFATIIPDFIRSLTNNLDVIIGGLVDGIVDSTASLITALVVDLPMALAGLVSSLVDPQFWLEVGRQIVKGFLEGFMGGTSGTEVTAESVGTGALDLLTGGLYGNVEKTARTGKIAGFATGGYIPRTGLYLMHQGERITPSSGASTGTAERGMGGPRGGGGYATASGGDIVFRVSAESLARSMRAHTGRGVNFGGS